MTRLIGPTSEQATPRTIISRYESTWTFPYAGPQRRSLTPPRRPILAATR